MTPCRMRWGMPLREVHRSPPLPSLLLYALYCHYPLGPRRRYASALRFSAGHPVRLPSVPKRVPCFVSRVRCPLSLLFRFRALRAPWPYSTVLLHPSPARPFHCRVARSRRWRYPVLCTTVLVLRCSTSFPTHGGFLRRVIKGMPPPFRRPLPFPHQPSPVLLLFYSLTIGEECDVFVV